MSVVSIYTISDKTFQECALAFLNAVGLSQATICDFVKRKVLGNPELTPEAFRKIIYDTQFEDVGYNGFSVTPGNIVPPEFTWSCQTAHLTTENPGNVQTIIKLLETSGEYQIEVTARNEAAAKGRIRKAVESVKRPSSQKIA